MSNPYPGLRSFSVGDGACFHGRDRSASSIYFKLIESKFVAVVGESGCGKSSLVKCGLVSLLRNKTADEWEVIEFEPKLTPFENMARSIANLESYKNVKDDLHIEESYILSSLRYKEDGLAYIIDEILQGDSSKKVLVVVDQFEELFSSYESGSEEAKDFVSLLLRCLKRKNNIYFALTMRSEYVGRCNLFFGLTEVVNAGLYMVNRLTRDEKKLAIRRPAEIMNVKITNDLVNQIVIDMGDDVVHLPLMQHVLKYLWDKKVGGDKREVFLADYEGVGSYRGALEAHVKELLANTADDDLFSKDLEKVLRCICKRNKDGSYSRRAVNLVDLEEMSGVFQSRIIDVMSLFVRQDAGIVRCTHADAELENEAVNSDRIYEIAHESVIESWKDLKGWVTEDYEFARRYRKLSERAFEWKLLDAKSEGGWSFDSDHKIIGDWIEEAKETGRNNSKWKYMNRDGSWKTGFGIEGEKQLVDTFNDYTKACRENQEIADRKKRINNRYLYGGLSLCAFVLCLSAANIYWLKLDHRSAKSLVVAKRMIEYVGDLERSNGGSTTDDGKMIYYASLSQYYEYYKIRKELDKSFCTKYTRIGPGAKELELCRPTKETVDKYYAIACKDVKTDLALQHWANVADVIDGYKKTCVGSGIDTHPDFVNDMFSMDMGSVSNSSEGTKRSEFSIDHLIHRIGDRREPGRNVWLRHAVDNKLKFGKKLFDDAEKMSDSIRTAVHEYRKVMYSTDVDVLREGLKSNGYKVVSGEIAGGGFEEFFAVYPEVKTTIRNTLRFIYMDWEKRYNNYLEGRRDDNTIFSEIESEYDNTFPTGVGFIRDWEELGYLESLLIKMCRCESVLATQDRKNEWPCRKLNALVSQYSDSSSLSVKDNRYSAIVNIEEALAPAFGFLGLNDLSLEHYKNLESLYIRAVENKAYEYRLNLSYVSIAISDLEGSPGGFNFPENQKESIRSSCLSPSRSRSVAGR